MAKKMKKIQPKTEQWLMHEFDVKYRALCTEYKMRIVVTPVWVARDDGSWSMILQPSVEKVPEKALSN